MKNYPIALALALLATSAFAAEPATSPAAIKLVPIPAGRFIMGSDQKPANWDEKPLHAVTISSPYLMSETEITADQFHQFKPDASLNPAYAPYAAGVSWNDAVAFCEWLSKKEGKPYRLPTEAEWEYACRAGQWTDATPSTQPAATQAATQPGNANPWGLKNMLAGPVEWCSDWYGEYTFAPETDPVGYADGFARVIRGGYLDTPEKSKPIQHLRPSDRSGAPPAFGPPADPPGTPNPEKYGLTRIGFRVVQAPPLATAPKPYLAPFARQGVKQTPADALHAADPRKPYFRRRRMLPIPPEDATQEAIIHAGLHPSFRGHNHSPGFAVLPNGDCLLIIYTSFWEYEPEVSLMAARLRCGADEWDMPTPMFDTPGANDHAPLLWVQPGTNKTWFFWGNPYAEGHYPFNFMTSTDNGATWSDVVYPHITGPLGEKFERPQPINTVLRDAAGTMYLAVDGPGGGPLGSSSMLWATSDDGLTWHDTLGRTGGRHTSFALLNDGRILGMGGKNSSIDNTMPESISSDGGKTYTYTKSPFSQLNSGQRPCIIRLQSGRLFFAADTYPSKKAKRLDTFKADESIVALSDDDGQTWRTKALPGADSGHRGKPSLGYCVARQGPNGMIHLITSLNHPAYHFEFNEAWILSDDTLADNDPRIDAPTATGISGRVDHQENYPDGKPHLQWHSGIGNDGLALLDGPETWLYPSGATQYQATYRLGAKVGDETYWAPDGKKQWEWHHNPDGTSVWITYWPDGTKRSQSTWKNRELIPGSDQFFDHPLELPAPSK